MKINIATLLLVALAIQINKAYPFREGIKIPLKIQMVKEDIHTQETWIIAIIHVVVSTSINIINTVTVLHSMTNT